jgi:hypothetical protein
MNRFDNKPNFRIDNRFDKPYRVLPIYDIKKAAQLFNIVSRLDTQELLQYTTVNQIPLDVENDNGDSLLHEVLNIDSRKVTEQARLNVIIFLVDHKVNPDKPNKENVTPLHRACKLQLELIVKYLIEIGCNTNFQDNMGNTPLHYLLNGDIKLEDNSNKVLDFIPPPNKDKKEKETVNMDIIQDIYDEFFKDKYTIDKQTIDSSGVISNTTGTYIDSSGISKSLFTSNTWQAGGADSTSYMDEYEYLKTPNIDKNGVPLPMLKTIKNTVEGIMNEDDTINKIKESFLNDINKSSNLSDKDIITSLKSTRQKLNESIKKRFNKLDDEDDYKKYIVLESGTSKTKDIIKETIKDATDNIKEIKYDGTIDNLDIVETYNDNYKKLLNNIDWNKIIQINNKKCKIIPTLYNVGAKYVNGYYFNPDDMMEYKHKNAGDFASDIIDFEKSTFMGGPRIITKISNKSVFIKTNIDNDLCKLIDSINKNPRMGNIITINNKLNNDNELIDKWNSIYMIDPNQNIGSLMFGLYTDYESRQGKNNLTYECSLEVLFYCAALGHGIDNMYIITKPQLVEKFNLKTKEDIINWIVFLFDYDAVDHTDYIKTNTLTRDIYTNNTSGPKYKLKEKFPILHSICSLIDIIYDANNLNKSIEKILETKDELKLFLKSYDNLPILPIDILLHIIVKYYTSLKVSESPMKQTLLDTIHIMREIYNEYKKDGTALKVGLLYNIKTQLVTNTHNKLYDSSGSNLTNTIQITDNIIPSKIGYLNIENLSANNDFKFVVAQILGLYYQGTLEAYNINSIQRTINFKGNDYNIHNLTNNITSTKHDNSNNNPSKLNEAIPYMFNFINPTNTNKSFVDKDYYILDGTYKYNPPTNDLYEYTINKKIEYYVNELKQMINILNKEINIMSKFNKIFMRYLRIIKLYNAMIKSFTTDKKFLYDYNTLALNLNKINSYYYLYYYLFAPNKMIKLSKFNYYQIPIDRESKYFYYDGSGNDMITDDDYTKQRNIIEYKMTGGADNEEHKADTTYLSGYINDFNIGDYDLLLKDYESKYPTNYDSHSIDYFKRLKSSSLPPSLNAVLGDFYKYARIETVRKIIKKVNKDKPNGIYKKLQELYDSKKAVVGLKSNEEFIYEILARCVEQILKNNTELYISNAITNNLKKMLEFNQSSLISPAAIDFVFKYVPTEVSLTNIDINYEDSSNVNHDDFINMYSIMKKANKDDDKFIIYPNDFANNSLMKSKTIIKIKKNILKHILETSNASIINNYEEYSPFYSPIKYYNYKILANTYKQYYSNELKQFINNEYLKNVDKLGLETKQLGTILKNIDGNLYKELEQLIQSNESYGNNILEHLENSFHMSSYLTLQYLSEELFNFNNIYTKTNFDNLFSSFSDMNKNYMFDKLNDYKINDDVNTYIAINLQEELKNKNDEIKNIIKNYGFSLDSRVTSGTIKKSKKYTVSYQGTNNYLNKLLNSSEMIQYLDILEKNTILNQKIGNIISGLKSNFIKNKSISDPKIITRYDKLNENKLLIIEIWNKLFTNNYSDDNYNLASLLLLNNPQSDVKNALEHISSIVEKYFEEDKYTDTNKVLRFIKDKLEYITRMVIGSGIEFTVRKILFSYFNSITPDKSVGKVTDTISYILESKDPIAKLEDMTISWARFTAVNKTATITYNYYNYYYDIINYAIKTYSPSSATPATPATPANVDMALTTLKGLTITDMKLKDFIKTLPANIANTITTETTTADGAITNASTTSTPANIATANDNIKKVVISYSVLFNTIKNIESTFKNNSKFNTYKQVLKDKLNQDITTNILTVNTEEEKLLKFAIISNNNGVSEKYDYILNKSLLDVLYDVVCPKLVKNSVSIFANRSEENAFDQESIQSILTEYFDRFGAAPVEIDKKVIEYLTKNVTSYFSSFTDRAIKLWYINAENIFKYFINMHRMYETKLLLNS